MKILIRHAESHDIKAIKELYEQPSCYSGTLQLPYPSEKLWQKRFEERTENVSHLVAVSDDKLLGQLTLETHRSPRRKHVASLGMAVSESVRGKGVGSQLLSAALELATNWLGVFRIEIEVYTENDPALELYKKHGFEIEGTGKQYAFQNGRFVDVYFMAKRNPIPHE